MEKYYTVGLLYLALCFTACRVNRSEDPVVIYTGAVEYQFDLFEKRDSTSGVPLFGLWAESLQIYDAGNYKLDYNVETSGRQINITILGVKKPDIQIGPASVASTFLPIGQLTDGTYQMNISLAGVVANKAVLEVIGGHYNVSLPNPEGIQFRNLVMDHVPDGMVWGYAAIANESQQPIANAFLLDLKPFTAEAGLAPGYYSYFTVTGTGDIYLHDSILPNGQAALFVRKLTGSRQELSNLLHNYRSQPLNIRCLTTFGEQ